MGQSVKDDRETDFRVILCFSFDHRAPVEEVTAFKQCLIDCPHVLHSIELSGTFDFMIEAGLPDLATYHQKLNDISHSLQRLVTRYEASFVCKRFFKREPRQAEENETLWVRSRDGFKSIRAKDIKWISAEGDYARLHLDGWSCLIHDTLCHLEERLAQALFLRVHRCAIVRRDFIERVIHEGRQWKVRLRDGTLQNVSKAHASEVLGTIRTPHPPVLAGTKANGAFSMNAAQSTGSGHQEVLTTRAN